MKVYLGIGTNIGDRERNLSESLQLIEEHIGRIKMVSSIYETEPWGFKSEQEFLNMAVETDTRLKPSGLIGRILMIEATMGRLRTEKEYSSRLIDIDILFYGDKILKASTLIIPHPRLHERKFVLVPLNDIAADIIHPQLGKTIKELLELCTDKSDVRLYKPS